MDSSFLFYFHQPPGLFKVINVSWNCLTNILVIYYEMSRWLCKSVYLVKKTFSRIHTWLSKVLCSCIPTPSKPFHTSEPEGWTNPPANHRSLVKCSYHFLLHNNLYLLKKEVVQALLFEDCFPWVRVERHMNNQTPNTTPLGFCKCGLSLKDTGQQQTKSDLSICVSLS